MGGSARRRRLGLTATVFSVVAVLMAPQAAFAATLTDGVIVRPKSTATFDFATSRTSWSAVAVYSPDQWNLSLYTGSGGWLASSTYPVGMTDFIAVNSDQLSPAPYRARATRVTGFGPYLQWRQATEKVVLPTPANDGVAGPGDPDLAYVALRSNEVVSVAYTWLAHGEAFWVNSLPNERFFFLETDPGNAGTAILSRDEAVRVPGMYVAGNCTLYRANHSGWHGLLLISDRAPVTTVPASGLAVTLHRFDPARPGTCPQRNFPDYTPPGP